MKSGTSKQGISYEIGNFQTGNFHMKLGTFKQGSSTVHMQSGSSEQVFHMKFVMSNQGNSIVHVKLGTSNQGNSYEIGMSKAIVSYEIWHLQSVTVFLCS